MMMIIIPDASMNNSYNYVKMVRLLQFPSCKNTQNVVFFLVNSKFKILLFYQIYLFFNSSITCMVVFQLEQNILRACKRLKYFHVGEKIKWWLALSPISGKNLFM